MVTHAISNLIRENKVFRIPSSIQTGKKLGMRMLDTHLFEIYAQGKVSMEDAIDRSLDPGVLQDKFEMFNKGQITLDDEGFIDPNAGDEDGPALRKG